MFIRTAIYPDCFKYPTETVLFPHLKPCGNINKSSIDAISKYYFQKLWNVNEEGEISSLGGRAAQAPPFMVRPIQSFSGLPALPSRH